MGNLTTAPIMSAAERIHAASYLWGQSATTPIVERRVAMTDIVTRDVSGNIALGGVTANYRITSYLGGAVANYIQVANGSTGAGAAVGLIVGLVAAGGGRIMMQGAFSLTLGAGNVDAAQITSAGGNLLMLPTGGVMGYGSGAAATQATDKSTGVTINKPTGVITMNGAALAAGAAVSFTLTNNKIAQYDVVSACIKSGAATGGSYLVTVDAVATGSCRISVRNLTGGSLSEALVLNFNTMRGANA